MEATYQRVLQAIPDHRKEVVIQEAPQTTDTKLDQLVEKINELEQKVVILAERPSKANEHPLPTEAKSYAAANVLLTKYFLLYIYFSMSKVYPLNVFLFI